MNIDDVFGSAGVLASHFKNYEERDGQVRMTKLVEAALATQTSAVIEGATGVGKSFAYLIPLILSGVTAIISTSNKSLQDQLSNKDLPSLKEIFKDIPFTWTVLKGKNNYFCHEHFHINEKEIESAFVRGLGISSTDATLELKKLLAWVETTQDGDVEFYPNDLPPAVRDLITCSVGTVHDKDSTYYDLCFANKARARAKEAQIVLVNHTLLALDISIRKETDNKVHLLPETKIVVIDEAHTFERSAVMAFSDDISQYSLQHLLNWSIVKKAVSLSDLQTLGGAMYTALNRFLPEKGDRGYYTPKKFEIFEGFSDVLALLEGVVDKVKHSSKVKKDDETQMKVKEITKEAEHLIERLTILQTKDDNMLRWSEAREGTKGNVIIRLKSVPIDISKFLQKELFEKHIVICTSATLAVGNSFDFFRYQVGMPNTALELVVESPFDFKKNALIYVSNGSEDKIYEVEQLLTYAKGRAFVLFTSFRDMRDFYEHTTIPYPKLIQDSGISRVKLLEEFRNTPNAVLFATKSFWEGVDVRGDGLVLVIIHKIPFENPKDLVYASKIEKIDKEFGKGKHWGKLTIPDACIKLKQGVGRLIRSKTDIGVIALLDARINYQNYGKTVMNAMPPAYRTQKLENVKVFFEKRNV